MQPDQAPCSHSMLRCTCVPEVQGVLPQCCSRVHTGCVKLPSMLASRLERWFDTVGITIEAGRVRIRATDGGLGIFAVRTVLEGDALCTIPKAAVLSVKTSGIADLLEENKIRGGLGLIIAILYELSLHGASPWYERPTASLHPAYCLGN